MSRPCGWMGDSPCPVHDASADLPEPSTSTADQDHLIAAAMAWRRAHLTGEGVAEAETRLEMAIAACGLEEERGR